MKPRIPQKHPGHCKAVFPLDFFYVFFTVWMYLFFYVFENGFWLWDECQRLRVRKEPPHQPASPMIIFYKLFFHAVFNWTYITCTVHVPYTEMQYDVYMYKYQVHVHHVHTLYAYRYMYSTCMYTQWIFIDLFFMHVPYTCTCMYSTSAQSLTVFWARWGELKHMVHVTCTHTFMYNTSCLRIRYFLLSCTDVKGTGTSTYMYHTSTSYRQVEFRKALHVVARLTQAYIEEPVKVTSQRQH